MVRLVVAQQRIVVYLRHSFGFARSRRRHVGRGIPCRWSNFLGSDLCLFVRLARAGRMGHCCTALGATGAAGGGQAIAEREERRLRERRRLLLQDVRDRRDRDTHQQNSVKLSVHFLSLCLFFWPR